MGQLEGTVTERVEATRKYAEVAMGATASTGQDKQFPYFWSRFELTMMCNF